VGDGGADAAAPCAALGASRSRMSVAESTHSAMAATGACMAGTVGASRATLSSLVGKVAVDGRPLHPGALGDGADRRVGGATSTESSSTWRVCRASAPSTV
jgi:hypothetical protein